MNQAGLWNAICPPAMAFSWTRMGDRYRQSGERVDLALQQGRRRAYRRADPGKPVNQVGAPSARQRHYGGWSMRQSGMPDRRFIRLALERALGTGRAKFNTGSAPCGSALEAPNETDYGH